MYHKKTTKKRQEDPAIHIQLHTHLHTYTQVQTHILTVTEETRPGTTTWNEVEATMWASKPQWERSQSKTSPSLAVKMWICEPAVSCLQLVPNNCDSNLIVEDQRLLWRHVAVKIFFFFFFITCKSVSLYQYTFYFRNLIKFYSALMLWNKYNFYHHSCFFSIHKWQLELKPARHTSWFHKYD